MNIDNLSGKTAVVTGAAGGIGAEITRLLGELEMNLVLSDIDRPGLEQLARSLPLEPLAVPADITDRKQVKDLFLRAEQRFGAVHVLVNSAGIIRPALFEYASYEDIDLQVNVNLTGVINVTREAIPFLKKSAPSHIVTISSLAGIVPETYSALYTAAKFALRGFGLTLNLELRRHSIRVSTIFPDSVDTPMLRYEAKHGGSPLTFLDPPHEAVDVARAVLKALKTGRSELYVPWSQALLSKLVMVFPWIVERLWPVLEKSGEKKKKAYQKRITDA